MQKKLMKIILSLCLFLSFLAASVQAADKDHETDASRTARPPLFDLNFRGGTPDELAAAIGAASGKKPNLLLSPGAEKVTLPGLQLRSVTTAQVFNALNLIIRTERDVVFTSTASSEVGGETIWTMLYATRPGKACKVFYVGDLLQKYKIEDVTTAIQSVWKMQGAEGELKFHQDTQLLIACAAHPPQLNIISEILAELSPGITLRALRKPGAAATPQDREKKKRTGAEETP